MIDPTCTSHTPGQQREIDSVENLPCHLLKGELCKFILHGFCYQKEKKKPEIDAQGPQATERPMLEMSYKVWSLCFNKSNQ